MNEKEERTKKIERVQRRGTDGERRECKRKERKGTEGNRMERSNPTAKGYYVYTVEIAGTTWCKRQVVRKQRRVEDEERGWSALPHFRYVCRSTCAFLLVCRTGCPRAYDDNAAAAMLRSFLLYSTLLLPSFLFAFFHLVPGFLLLMKMQHVAYDETAGPVGVVGLSIRSGQVTSHRIDRFVLRKRATSRLDRSSYANSN